MLVLVGFIFIRSCAISLYRLLGFPSGDIFYFKSPRQYYYLSILVAYIVRGWMEGTARAYMP